MFCDKRPSIALAAAPAIESWRFEPSYFSTPLSLRLEETPVQRVRKRQRRLATKLGGCPNNKYDLIDNDELFQLTMDVPGVKEEDIDIKLDDGQLTVQGQRAIGSGSSRFSSRFLRTFSLDPTVDIDGLAATLKNGVLTVSAPKDSKKLEGNVRRIPITSVEDTSGKDSKEDKETIDVDEDSKPNASPSDTMEVDASGDSQTNNTKTDKHSTMS